MVVRVGAAPGGVRGAVDGLMRMKPAGGGGGLLGDGDGFG